MTITWTLSDEKISVLLNWKICLTLIEKAGREIIPHFENFYNGYYSGNTTCKEV